MATTIPRRKLSHEEYTVGWICPLKVEKVAALEMLDEEHDALEQPPADHNVYNLGSIGGHNVVITGLHQAGNSPAATAVAQMLTTFPKVRFGLLVGIGGGVPVKTESGFIRLGHVVVSKPTGEHSGAVEYDRGKAEARCFRRTGALAPPPRVLLNAVFDLEAQRDWMPDDPVAKNLTRIDTNVSGLQKYRHPGLEHDRLYQRDYVHRNRELLCDECGCDPRMQLKRSTGDEDQTNGSRVVAHMGTIASGSLVIRNDELRDHLAQQYGVLCFEMEAAGALLDFPCIVIRGISDYCDSHKNDNWHGYAAAAAAAYARQLFFHMPVEEVKRYISLDTQDKIDTLVESNNDREGQIIADWLTPVDYGLHLSNYINKQQKGTGKWFIESREFNYWLSQRNQTLFCPGEPGAGKTMMASIAIDYLQNKFRSDLSVGIAYVYCYYKPQYGQRDTDLLLALLKQLVQAQPSLPTRLESLYADHKYRCTRPSFSEISEVLRSVIAEYSRVFIIVDGVDNEYQNFKRDCMRFLSEIFDLQAKTGLNVLATSPHIPEIEKIFRGSSRIKIHATDDDLRTYVDGMVPQFPEFVSKDMRLQEEIKTEILETSTGIGRPEILEERLNNSQFTVGSSAYDVAYTEAMERIESQNIDLAELAKEAMAWITLTKRPLTELELQHALATSIDDSTLDGESTPQIKHILSVCAGLIIKRETGTVHLIHDTLREYLERTLDNWFPHAQKEITRFCITYLSFDHFTGIYSKDSDFKDRLRRYPFYKYAAQNWGYHARAASQELNQTILDFLETESLVPSLGQALMALTTNTDIDATEELLRKRHDPNFQDICRRTPLFWASNEGHEAVVKVLLSERCIDVNRKDKDGLGPLRFALKNGHETVTSLLLDQKGIDINSKDDRYDTPLTWAIGDKNGLVVKKLLAQAGTDINSKGIAGFSPLSMACGGSSADGTIVKLLLDKKGIDPNQRDMVGFTPLLHASLCGNELAVKLPLERDDVDVNTRDRIMSHTALHWAAIAGHMPMTRLPLSKSGIKPDARDSIDCHMAPSFVIKKGHIATVILLLGVVRPFGITKLLLEIVKQRLLGKDEMDNIVILLPKAVNVPVLLRLWVTKSSTNPNNNWYGDRRTPLSLATANGHKEIVEILLTHGNVNPNSKDYIYGWTPLM
ncbi:hypothetical protein F5884DRAFT_894735 [Xylogone sp. PMI_703]|nr:hypothetical protein F5884DRAFT_894735 [Xylogone sp. PMI_703]